MILQSIVMREINYLSNCLLLQMSSRAAHNNVIMLKHEETSLETDY